MYVKMCICMHYLSRYIEWMLDFILLPYIHTYTALFDALITYKKSDYRVCAPCC